EGVLVGRIHRVAVVGAELRTEELVAEELLHPVGDGPQLVRGDLVAGTAVVGVVIPAGIPDRAPDAESYVVRIGIGVVEVLARPLFFRREDALVGFQRLLGLVPDEVVVGAIDVGNPEVRAAVVLGAVLAEQHAGVELIVVGQPIAGIQIGRNTALIVEQRGIARLRAAAAEVAAPGAEVQPGGAAEVLRDAIAVAAGIVVLVGEAIEDDEGAAAVTQVRIRVVVGGVGEVALAHVDRILV